MPTAPRVLIADDQPDVIEALSMLLRHAGHEVITANSPAAVLTEVETRDFDAALLDLNYAGPSAIAAVNRRER